MTILRIEHPVKNFESWQKAFDADPVDRRGSGVRRYRVMRATDDPRLVMIDLELDSVADAQRLLGKLRELWSRVQATALDAPPRTQLLDLVDSVVL